MNKKNCLIYKLIYYFVKNKIITIDFLSVITHNINMKEIKYYITESGKCPFKIWLDSLDKSIMSRIDKRLIRLTEDNYGEYKVIDNNISELKFNFGSGYRIYYTEKDNIIIILLCAGDKKTQSKDIEKAKEYFIDWKGRENEK